MLATLEDAINVIHRGGMAKTERENNRRLVLEARAWVMSNDRSWLFSFVKCMRESGAVGELCEEANFVRERRIRGGGHLHAIFPGVDNLTRSVVTWSISTCH